MSATESGKPGDPTKEATLPEIPPATAPATEEETLTVHPGDVVQITDQKNKAFGCLLIVEACHGWGVGATMHWTDGTRLWESYHRLKPDQFAVVGAAAVVKPDVLAARRDSLGMQELVRQEGR